MGHRRKKRYSRRKFLKAFSRYRKEAKRVVRKKRSRAGKTYTRNTQVPFNNVTRATSRPRISARALSKLFQYRNVVSTFTTPNTVGAGIDPYTYCRQPFVENNRKIGNNSDNPVIQRYRPHSTFQCNATNGSGQPKGRDVMVSLYLTYAVISCKYAVKVRNLHSAPVRCWLAVSQDGTTLFHNTWDEAIVSPSTKTAVLSGTSENDGQESTTFTGTIVSKDYLRSSDIGNFQAGFMATIGTSPSQGLEIQLLAQSDIGVAIGTNLLQLDVMMTYDVVYFNPVKGALADT